MDIEGTWQGKQTMIGYELDTETFTIALPRAKIEGARTFVQGDHFVPGSIQLRAQDVQISRGLAQHWLVACFFGRAMLGVLDALLQHSGGK